MEIRVVDAVLMRYDSEYHGFAYPFVINRIFVPKNFDYSRR
jgi:hypothetical protein